MAVLRRALPLLVLAACWPVSRAGAFPAFSRQTGGACTLCHFQDMHSLNAYGREFLQNSFHETPRMLRQRRQMQQQAGKSGAGRDGQSKTPSGHASGGHGEQAR